MGSNQKSVWVGGLRIKIPNPPQSKKLPLELLETQAGQTVLLPGEQFSWRVAFGLCIGASVCLFGVLLLLKLPQAIIAPPDLSIPQPAWIQSLIRSVGLVLGVILTELVGAAIIQGLIRFGWTDTEVTISDLGMLHIRRSEQWPYKKDQTVPLEKIRRTSAGSWGIYLIAPGFDYRRIQNWLARKSPPDRFVQSEIAKFLPSEQITIFGGRSRAEIKWAEYWLHQHIDRVLADFETVERLRYDDRVTQLVAQSV